MHTISLPVRDPRPHEQPIMMRIKLEIMVLMAGFMALKMPRVSSKWERMRSRR